MALEVIGSDFNQLLALTFELNKDATQGALTARFQFGKTRWLFGKFPCTPHVRSPASCFWLLLTMGRTCKATNCHLVIIYITELIAVITIQTASHTSLIGFASSCHSQLILSGCFPDEYFTETLVRVHAGFAMPSTLSKPHQTINLVAACWLYLPLTSHARA